MTLRRSKSTPRGDDLADLRDSIVHHSEPKDVWDQISKPINGLFQDFIFEHMDKARAEAREIALKEKAHHKYRGVLKIKLETANMPKAKAYFVRIEVQEHRWKSKTAESSATPRWDETTECHVHGGEFNIKLAITTGGFLPDNFQSHFTVKTSEFKEEQITLPIGKTGSIVFHAALTSVVDLPPAEHRGFLYWDKMPVLDPTVPLPDLAKPDNAFTTQDESMTRTMELIAVYWMVFGADAAMKALPMPLTDRVDKGQTAEWFTHRRLNGSCPGFIRPNPNKSEAEPWDLQIEWDFRKKLDRASDVKQGATLPDYCCARFVLSEDGTQVLAHSIKYTVPDAPAVEQKSDGTIAWKAAMKVYKLFEVNTRFTYAHVGVHFNCEQYAMPVYRNLRQSHPIYVLLDPHFKNLITNNRKVVRPKPDGVVSMADAYTFDGQIKLLKDRFRMMSFKDTPKRIVPETVRDNDFENAEQLMWKIVSEYVEGYFAEHGLIKEGADEGAATLDPEIQELAKDLEQHALNKTEGAMSLKTPEDLLQMCKYVIHQCIFYHAWVHWNGYDDFFPVLQYAENGHLSPKGSEKLEDRSNMIQSFVTFVSPSLKQWPILDPELGGNQKLRDLLMNNAGKLNKYIQIGTLIMSPNT